MPEPAPGVAVLRSGCKINLFLDITAVRPDGRHELRTLFWPLDAPYDELRLSVAAPGDGLRLVCNSPEVDQKRNTLCSAWEGFAAATGYSPDLVLELHKNVPTGAGLGGGSANAAALLLWLNAQVSNQTALSAHQLAEVAAGVGADVPFFLLNRPALGTGIGDILQPCPKAAMYAGMTLLLVSPPISVSTGAAFKAYDDSLPNPVLQNSALTKFGQADKEIHSLRIPFGVPALLSAHHVRNSLEPVVFDMHPELSRLKVELARHGAAASGMSGSGASLFGLFRDASIAQKAALAVQGPGVRVWVQELRF